jgi:hypothetical protein
MELRLGASGNTKEEVHKEGVVLFRSSVLV